MGVNTSSFIECQGQDNGTLNIKHVLDKSTRQYVVQRDELPTFSFGHSLYYCLVLVTRTLLSWI